MKGFVDGLNRLAEAVGCGVQILTVAITVFLLVLSSLQVFLRQFNLPQMGVEELMQFPVIWMYMLGGACASFTRTHIECGILDSFIKNRTVLDIFAVVKTFLSMAICAITIYWAYNFLLYSIKTNKISVILGLPWVAANAALFVGLVLMEFFTIVEFIQRIHALCTQKEAEA